MLNKLIDCVHISWCANMGMYLPGSIQRATACAAKHTCVLYTQAMH